MMWKSGVAMQVAMLVAVIQATELSHYEVLGVKRGARRVEIRKAYYTMVKK
jgi:hypothetical protein